MKAAQYYTKKTNWIDPYGKLWKERKYFYILNPKEPKEPKAIAAKFPMMIQPKVNGVRAFLYLDEEGNAKLKSKDGLIYTAPSHITDWVNMNIDLIGKDNTIIFDGELYIHGENLQDIQSAVKAYNINTPRVKFILFDLAIPDMNNLERWKTLKEIYAKYASLDTPLELIRTFMISTDEKTQEVTDQFIEQGYEGSILRSPNAEYGFGSRKNTMLKLKRCISMDFDIVRISRQPKRPDLGMFECVYKGKEFTVNPTFSEEDKAKLLISPYDYIGKKLQTRFYEWSNDNKPMHVIETVIRDYE
jgi:ATP-dependent DNA ligase